MIADMKIANPRPVRLDVLYHTANDDSRIQPKWKLGSAARSFTNGPGWK